MSKVRASFWVMVLVIALALPAAALGQQAPVAADKGVAGVDYTALYVSDDDLPVIVLVPGAYMCKEHMVPLQAELARRQRNSIALSLRGHCNSPGDPTQARVEDYAGDVLAVVRAEGLDRYELWGFSTGSVVVRVYGLQYGLDGGKLKGVVHVAPTPMTKDRMLQVLGYYYEAFPAAMQCFLQTSSMACLRDDLSALFVNNLSPAQWGPWVSLLTRDESPFLLRSAQGLADVDVFSAAREVPETIVQPIWDRAVPAEFVERDAALIEGMLEMIGGTDDTRGHIYWLDLPQDLWP